MVTEEFAPIAARIAALEGRNALGRVVLPYPFEGLPEHDVRAHAIAAFPAVLTGLGATP